VLLRHGQSTWNDENRFTGWSDPPPYIHLEQLTGTRSCSAAIYFLPLDDTVVPLPLRSDPPLTARGEEETRAAATLLRGKGLEFDVCFTSALSRAKRTGALVTSGLLSGGDGGDTTPAAMRARLMCGGYHASVVPPSDP
jgi:2,3-bisphosphoglycerate-dependent phosphoglycerate mutase